MEEKVGVRDIAEKIVGKTVEDIAAGGCNYFYLYFEDGPVLQITIEKGNLQATVQEQKIVETKIILDGNHC
jgi:hypothetical protein